MKSRVVLRYLLVIMVVGSSLLSAETTYWQLLVSYDNSGIYILEAGPIPPSLKQVRTPGLIGTPLRISYDLEWLDDANSVIAATVAEMPLGIRAIPVENDSAGCRVMMPEQGMFVIRIVGPEPTAAPRSVRLNRVESLLRVVPGLSIPPAFEQSTAVLPIQRLASSGAALVPGPISATKLRDTGPDNNRLVFVVLGDGYTAANLAAGEFTADAAIFAGSFGGRSPWDALFNGTNVYRIDVESNEQGADHETYGVYKDTYLNSSFWVNNIERLLAIDGTGYSRAVSAANSLIGYGLWDNIFVLVNSTKYGGSGGSIGVSSVHSAMPDILLHESGHTYGGLADEYSDPYPGYPSGDPEPNVDFDYSGPALKWNIWVTPGVPLPTEPQASYPTSVGAFEGARYLTTGIYRPVYNCEMRALYQQFCPVCKEAHVNRYTTMINLLDGATPAWNTNVMLPLTGKAITVEPIPIGQMQYTWRLNSVLLPDTIGSTITLTTKDYYAVGAVNQAYLDLAVKFPTTLVRQNETVESYRWTVYADCNNNGVSDIQDIISHTSQDENANLIPDECDSQICCVDVTGNINLQGTVDLSDLSALVSYLTGSGYILPCYNEANVNGTGIVDLSDLSALISYLTGGGYQLANCP